MTPKISHQKNQTVRSCYLAAMVRSSCRLTLVALASVHLSALALAKDAGDDDDRSTTAASGLPNTYLDLRTNYATTPANSLSIGFSSPSLSTAIATLQSLSTLTNATMLPNLPTVSAPSSQSLGIDVPLTVDINDRISLYGGFTASASQSGTSDWSTPAISSWNVGFQADMSSLFQRMAAALGYG